MNPIQQRIEIATVCGWKDIIEEDAEFDEDNCPMTGLSPTSGNQFRRVVPYYSSCLNAMHEAEKVLKARASYSHSCIWKLYETMLARIIPGDCGMFHATAAQRAKAFLQALGKWKD